MEDLCSTLDVIWGSGKDNEGFWCELWSADSTSLYRGSSLKIALEKAIKQLTLECLGDTQHKAELNKAELHKAETFNTVSV